MAEEVIFWSLLSGGVGSFMLSFISGWLIRTFGGRLGESRHGFAQSVTNPGTRNQDWIKPEYQDWISQPLRSPGFWFKLGGLLLIAASVITAIARLIEAINSLVD